MSNADMLQLQMDKFHEVIAANIRRKGQKIVFIHGKGEGVLRNELMKALKNRYKTFYVQDASFREYGYGATMIVIR
jgi:dsDNA-specific endonuclease/ATPase MutS2